MKKLFRFVFLPLFVLFVLFNAMMAIHSYSFTHFVVQDSVIAGEGMDYSPALGLGSIFTGMDIARPEDDQTPMGKYTDVIIDAGTDKELHGWLLHTDSAKRGIILLFHGYIDSKSSMLPEAETFVGMGYDVLLIDFMGSGKSYGNQTTMGFLEGDNVYQTYLYAKEKRNEKNIYLYGFSMGAAAIMKAQSDHQLDVEGMIMQAPYATFEGTIGARVKSIGLPRYPTSLFMAYWMGRVNGFDGLEANPIDFAKQIQVPALLLCGAQDSNIPPEETQAIYRAIASENKKMQLFDHANHESLLKNDAALWNKTLREFLCGKEKE